MTDEFEPRNELEQCLADAQAGRVSGEAFMRVLMKSQVFMPIYESAERAVGNIQLDSRARPLLVEGEGGAKFLALFTSPERAGAFVKDYPGYEEGGLLAEFTWILEKTGLALGDLGVSINPGWPVGIELEPEAARQLGGWRH